MRPKNLFGAVFGGGLMLALIANNVVQADSKKAPKPKAVAAPKGIAGIKGGVERTFIAVKPDGTQRALVGQVISRFERKGYKLVGLKAVVPTRALAEVHYADLKTRPFFNGLVNYMTSGAAPVVAMVWEGPDVIRQGRRLIGATNPLDAEPGTIRGDFCISVGRNIIHGSDSYESASIEIPLWFTSSEIYDWEFGNAEWVTSNN
ncbi:nucleoside diphosphate kinase [Globomyces pollinis-pini]|nr:nucleoside diphosphate kinase [Globomyces pollinis-pini]